MYKPPTTILLNKTLHMYAIAEDTFTDKLPWGTISMCLQTMSGICEMWSLQHNWHACTCNSQGF